MTPFGKIWMVFATVFLLIHVILAKTVVSADDFSDEDLCSDMVCRAGRECRVRDGAASCHCIKSCGDNFVPVCGSNSKSYDNYCELHRDACISGVHISVRSKGYCPKSSKKSKSKPALTKTKSNKNKKQNEDDFLSEPVVCFQWERDALRRQIMSYFKHHTTDQSWYRPDLTSNEKLWGRFYVCDSSKDNFLDANEFLQCVKDVTFSLRSTASYNELVKALCVDAIVDAGDSNSDWRLEFEEFKTLLDPDFQPEEKLCSLEGKKYEDGAQTKVDCNDCVCACGSWVCTSKSCDKNSFDEDAIDDSEDDDDVYDDENEDNNLSVKVLEIEEEDESDDLEDNTISEDLDDDEDDDNEDAEDVEPPKKKKKNRKGQN